MAAAPLDHPVLLKLLLVGNTEAGKSSLLIRYADGSYNSMYTPNIGKETVLFSTIT